MTVRTLLLENALMAFMVVLCGRLQTKVSLDCLLTLQRHLRVLTKFAHVESRLSGHKRQTEVVFYAPVNLCEKRACSASVAVGLRP